MDDATVRNEHQVFRTLSDDSESRLRQTAFRSPDRDPTSLTSASTSTKDETILLTESFEESWPAAPWSVFHSTDAAEVDWGRTDYRASEKSHSIWCAGSGADSPNQGDATPIDTESWAVAGPFDLSEATAGSLTFDLWLKTEAFNDLFMWLVSTDGKNFRGSARSTNTDGWQTITEDLTDWGQSGDLTGEAFVWIAFVYQSDHSKTFEGAYVDHVTLIGDSGTTADDGRTYTTNADFALGTLLGVEADTNKLQLSSTWTTFDNLWVPNNRSGTVSKVDTTTGAEMARYRTGPDRELTPIAIAVDLEGSCWVGNRDAGTVVKIGLLEADTCIDHNNNGSIDTSADSNEDGNINSDEILPWGSDECVLYEIVLVDGEEDTYAPGAGHGDWTANGLRGLAVDADNNIWASVSDSSRYYHVNGSSGKIVTHLDTPSEETSLYGLVVDKYGYLWSGTWPDALVLQIDPTSGEITEIELNHGAYGLALDDQDHLMISGFEDFAYSQVDITTNEEVWFFPAAWQSAGIAVTENGEQWVAATGSNSLSRFNNEGQIISNVPVSNQPSATAVDAGGRVWVVGAGNDYIVRMNPVTNRAELQKTLIDAGGHEAAGDLTGIVPRTVTMHYGAWTVVWDSLSTDTAWGTISWIGDEPEETTISVRVRSSTDQHMWSSWETAENAKRLAATPFGRYLQIDVALQTTSDDTTPILEELTVKPNSEPVPRSRRATGRVSP